MLKIIIKKKVQLYFFQLVVIVIKEIGENGGPTQPQLKNMVNYVVICLKNSLLE